MEKVEGAVSYLSSKVSSPMSQLPAATLDLPVAMAHGAIFSITPTLKHHTHTHTYTVCILTHRCGYPVTHKQSEAPQIPAADKLIQVTDCQTHGRRLKQT